MRYKKDIFYNEGSETVEQIRNIQGEVGQGSEPPDVIKDVPAFSQKIGLNDF